MSLVLGILGCHGSQAIRFRDDARWRGRRFAVSASCQHLPDLFNPFSRSLVPLLNGRRSEHGRRSRERKAVEMSILQDHSEENLAQVRPIPQTNELGRLR
jgi:hypothetical protein